MPPPEHREFPSPVAAGDAILARALVLLLAIAPLGLLFLEADPEPAPQRPIQAPPAPFAVSELSEDGDMGQRAPAGPDALWSDEKTIADSDGGMALAPDPSPVSGTVLDPEGQPAAGVEVTLGAGRFGGAHVEPSAGVGTLPPYLHEEAPALVAAVSDLAAEGLGVVPGAVPVLPTSSSSLPTTTEAVALSTRTGEDGRFQLWPATEPGGPRVLWAYQPATGARATLLLSSPYDGSRVTLTLSSPPPPQPTTDAPPSSPPPPPRLFTLPPVELSSRRNGVYVRALGPGADDSPLRPGDRILRIDGEQVLAAAQARSMLRGRRHTRVRLVLLRDGQRMPITLTRP